jgi:hypothetical protein
MPSSLRPTRDSQVRLRAAPDEVTINDWGVRDRPLATSVALTLAAGASWLAAWASGSFAIGAIVAALLVAILWRTWLPVLYQLNGSGITQSVLGWRRHLPWTAFASYEARESGAFLYADSGGRPLGSLRGFLLPWGPRREQILAVLEFYVPRQ